MLTIERECTSGAVTIVTLEEQVVAARPVVGMVLAIERDHNVFWHTVRTELQIPAPGDAGRHEANRNRYPQQQSQGGKCCQDAVSFWPG